MPFQVSECVSSPRCVSACETVLEAPTSFTRFGDAHDVRCAHAVGRFPHLVVYMLVGDENRQTVHVLAFMHPRQRPGYWTAASLKINRTLARPRVPVMESADAPESNHGALPSARRSGRWRG